MREPRSGVWARSTPRCATTNPSVLPRRGRERCRHFVLDQLPNGHYVILGEHSAHPELAELLQHYARIPIPPYGELLTVPRGQVSMPAHCSN